MGFRSGAYVKLWKIAKGTGNFLVAECSTSKKKEDKSYETDWSNKFVRLVGTAKTQAEKMSDGASAKIGSCEVTNSFSKEKNTTYTNYVIYSFEEDGEQPKQTKSTSKATPQNAKSSIGSDGFMDIPDGIDEELPFN